MSSSVFSSARTLRPIAAILPDVQRRMCFLLNTLLAAGLAWLGDRIGVNLALVAVIALGTRVFLNLSLIRRYYLNKLAMARSRQQSDNAASLATAAQKTE